MTRYQCVNYYNACYDIMKKMCDNCRMYIT